MTRIITLMTDFGSQDGYVGAILGRLYTEIPGAKIIDITHDIEPQNIWQAAFSLKRYAPQFPENTIHIVVVDPGVGSERLAVALRCDNHWLIGPNNGVLSLAAAQYRSVTAYGLKSETPWWKKHTSFDGLALFAPAAGCLADNEIELSSLATPIDSYHQLTFPPAELIGDQLIGQILAFDRFGNAITNISHADLPRHHIRQILSRKHTFPFHPFYCEAQADSRVAIINSDGLLELAVYQSSAREELELEVGDSVTVTLHNE